MTITTDTTLLHDPRRQAALLYWQGFSVPQIAAMLQMKRPTVQSWKQRDGWDNVAPISRVEMSLEARLTQLIIKPQKTGGDFKEIDLLGRQIERLARVNRYSQTGNEADLNPNVANRNKGGRRKPKKNFSVTRPSKSWSRFSLSSLSTISCTGIAPGLSTASAIS